MSKTTADLLKEIERWRDNARETWSAMNAMRDAINEFVPMPGLDSDLLQGPDNGVFCETVANAVIMQIQALSDEIATLTVARDAQNDIIERCAVQSLPDNAFAR